MGKLTIEIANAIALERGGQCLSEKYTNNKTPLLWRCNLGHEWSISLNRVKDGGTWCPNCTGAKRLSIDDAHKIAAQRGGQCLSEVYINNSSPLLWKCEFGHEWKAAIHSVKDQGTWCLDCSGKKQLSIEDAHKIAIERGGQCLSEVYINANNPLLWKCREEHQWRTSLSKVKGGSWCPECAGVTKWTIEELNTIANERGGHLLSTEYINIQSPLEWICSDGHKWKTASQNVIRGHWCPICRASHGERAIHDWLTQNKIDFIPEYNFPDSRRKYDFYIPSTNWLIEFDGGQHFKDVKFFSNTPLEKRQQADREKTQLAIVNGCCLLRIHYEDINRIPELLPMTTIKAPPQIVCSRVSEYAYLNTSINVAPKRLTLKIVSNLSTLIKRSKNIERI